jgi:membrane-anchored glycerophosphoryl diester phosphodiesterase (GDPDase)
MNREEMNREEMNREEMNREEMNREEMNRWTKQSGLLVGLLVLGAGFLNLQFGQRLLQFLLPVSETAQVDYLRRILHRFEHAFLVLLLDPLLLLQVGLIYCDLRVGVLDLVQDRGEQLLQLFDLLRVPSQTHIAETIHFGLLQGGQVKVDDVVA